MDHPATPNRPVTKRNMREFAGIDISPDGSLADADLSARLGEGQEDAVGV